MAERPSGLQEQRTNRPDEHRRIGMDRQIASPSLNQRSPTRRISACCASKSPATLSRAAFAIAARGCGNVLITT